MKNVVEHFVEEVVGNIRLKNSVHKFGGKVALNNCMEQYNQQLCGNLG